ncbi:MAG: DNA-directed RNA polymerase specialized sigma24 family protein [Myxococcota bacterium]|jgi:DNA-directed RNA polymerase specialized sigma24 family protein
MTLTPPELDDLRAYIHALTDNITDTDDIAQEAQCRLLTQTGIHEALAWCKTIARRLVIDSYRDASRYAETMTSGADVTTYECELLAVIDLRNAQASVNVTRHQDKLRMWVEGWSYVDIGAEAGQSGYTAQKHVEGAVDVLRAQYHRVTMTTTGDE